MSEKRKVTAEEIMANAIVCLAMWGPLVVALAGTGHFIGAAFVWFILVLHWGYATFNTD